MKKKEVRKALVSTLAVLMSVSLASSSFAAGTLGYLDKDNNVIKSPVAGGFKTTYAGGEGTVITAVYDKLAEKDSLVAVSVGEQIDLDTIDGYEVRNFVWDSLAGVKPLEAEQTSVVNLEVTAKEGYVVLNWKATNNTADCTYKITRDDAVIAENIPASDASYVDVTDDAVARSYQVEVIKNAETVGTSNAVSAAALERVAPTAPAAPEKDFSDSIGKVAMWEYDQTQAPTVSNGLAYTDPQLMVNYDQNIWTIVTEDNWMNRRNGDKWEVKNFGYNVIKLKRGENLQESLVIIFGDDIRQFEQVNVTFDQWGSKRWQNAKCIYGGGELGLQVDQDNWQARSVTTTTDMELSAYGYAGKYGIVITYPGGPDSESYIWIKNIKVSKADTFCSTVTADASNASYADYSSDIVPSGNNLTGFSGNAIAGSVIVSSASAWANAMGYAYKNVNGTDAFYLTQMYDITSNRALWVDKSYMAFDIANDINCYGPGSWVNIVYYDGTLSDMRTSEFHVYVNKNRYNDMIDLGTITMTNSNEWKSFTAQLPADNSYFNKKTDRDDLDSMDIAVGMPTANNGYNKNGILIKSVSVMDDAYKTNILPKVEEYNAKKAEYDVLYAKYEKELEEYNKGIELKYPNGAYIDFNENATGEAKIVDWENELLTGAAYKADCCNLLSDWSDRTTSFGLHGPEGDKRYAISTESFTDVRAIGGAAGKESGKATYIYGKVDADYIDSSSQYAEVEITYYDYTTNNMCIRFKRDVASGHHMQFIAQTGTNTWKTATFRLEDALFNKSDAGYDFRLSLESDPQDNPPKQLIISKMVVRSAEGKTQAVAEVNEVPDVYIIGDSIAAQYFYVNHVGEGRYGWGEKLDLDDVKVYDFAVAGTSTKTYCKNSAIEAAKENDYVLISFGHNDSTEGEARSTTVEEYKENLANMILQVMEKGAVPVIITSIPSFDGENVIIGTDGVAPYRAAALEVAEEYSVPSIDLGAIFAQDANANTYFVEDNLHLNEAGATAAAEIVKAGLLNNSKIRTLKKYVQ